MSACSARRAGPELAAGAAALEVLVRLPDVGKRIGGAQLRHELAAGRAREQVAKRLLHHVATAEAVHEPETDDRAALSHQPAGLDRVLLAAGDPVGNDPAEWRKRLGALVEDAASGHLEHHVDRPALVRLDQSALEVLRTGVDRGVGAELERLRPLLLGAGRRDHAPGSEWL